MKKWEHLKLYKDAKQLFIPDNFYSSDNGGDYWFTLLARFKNIEDAESFAKFKSYSSKPWFMFSVTKNLDGDAFAEYYVYEVMEKC